MRGVLTARSLVAIAAAGCIGFAAAPAREAAASPSDALARRVQRIEDHITIERLLLDYGQLLDRRDFAGYAGLFARDGEWSGSVGTFRGPAAIRLAMEKAFAAPAGRPVDPAPPRSFHLLTNAMIDIDGDRARVVSKWTFVRVVDNKPVVANAGRYEDVLVREDGKWKFKSRVAPSVLSPVPG